MFSKITDLAASAREAIWLTPGRCAAILDWRDLLGIAFQATATAVFSHPGRLDTKTLQVTEYPFPYSENMIKEFFLDSKGRIWFGTPPNNKVGYFTVPSGN